jgi:hypothetical protein
MVIMNFDKIPVAKNIWDQLRLLLNLPLVQAASMAKMADKLLKRRDKSWIKSF